MNDSKNADLRLHIMRVALDYLIPIWERLWKTIRNHLLDRNRQTYEKEDMVAPANIPLDFTLRLSVWDEQLSLQAAIAVAIIDEMEKLKLDSVDDDVIISLVRNKIFDVLMKEGIAEENELKDLLRESTRPRFWYV